MPSAHVRAVASDVVPNPTRRKAVSHRAGAWKHRPLTAPPPELDRLESDALRGFGAVLGHTNPPSPDSDNKIVCGEGHGHPCLLCDHRSTILAVTLPLELTSIGAKAFSGATRLASVVVEHPLSSVPMFEHSASELGGMVRALQRRLPTATFLIASLAPVPPDGSIGDYAFFRCIRLKSIVFPAATRAIGVAAFAECSNLVSLRLPGAVRTLGDGAFYRCTELVVVELPDSIIELGEFVFAECVRLFSVSLSAHLRVVPRAAFCEYSSEVYSL